MSSSSTPRSPRTLVLCFDGTSDNYDDKNSNVAKLFAILHKDLDDEQLCYYQSGIGTYENPGIFTPLLMWLTAMLDEGIAFYLSAHVMGGYNFLMDNYRAGDKVCIFGFSRGAYTARALAGFITKVGLLPRGNVEQVAFAYRLFAKDEKNNNILAEGFKSQFCRPITIEFLGVWDTVASTGLITSKNLPFTTNNHSIKTFRHALALDERRVRFEPTYFQTTAPPWARNNFMSKLFYRIWGRHREAHQKLPSIPSNNVKEVWFMGDHCDIGGGWVSNSTLHSVANIPLKWMIQEIIETGCGIKLNEHCLKNTFSIDTTLSQAQYFGLSEISENQEDQAISQANSKSTTQYTTVDAMQPIHDTLQSHQFWWILELFPNVVSWQSSSGNWRSRAEIHFGRGRYVNRVGQLYFHESVRTRMALAGYRPRANYSPDDVKFIW